jgi:hypothetical protein
MLCRFKKMDTEWICPDCGRRSKISDKPYCPSAICRLPPKDPVVMSRNYKKNIAKLHGVGYQLQTIIKSIFNDISFSVEFLSFLQKINNKGKSWCHTNMNYLIGEMKKECLRKRMKFSTKGAKSLVRLAMLRTQTVPH